jgi:hypothetical protein
VPESHSPDPNDPMVAVLAAVANGVAAPLTTAPVKAAPAAAQPARQVTSEPTWP